MRKKNTASTYDIAKAAAVEALKIHRDEERQQIRRSRYHNTELLLKNYLNLLDHYENAKDKASDIMSVEDMEDLDVDEIIIKAIKRSRVRTMIMITQIESCLDILRINQANKGQPEKYEVIFCLFLDRARRDISWGELIATVAHELSCSTDSVRRWKNEMVRELSILLFGVDGLRLDI